MRPNPSAERPTAARVPVDPVAALLELLYQQGIAPANPEDIAADGVLRRFRIEGDRRGTLNGWAVLHSDHGAAGSWKTGASCTWSSKATDRMTPQEREAHVQQIRQATAAAQRQREAVQTEAAARADALWTAARPADRNHPYLARKRIAAGPARQSCDLLVLKIENIRGETRSLQFIDVDGVKRLLSGGSKKGNFIIVSGSLPADLIVLAEGFSTASTIATQFPRACTLSAIDAGNLEPVALAIRAKFPAAQIIIAADDDRLTPGNPGLTKARAAAAAVGGKLVRPVWPDGAPDALSDFNDLAVFMEGATC